MKTPMTEIEVWAPPQARKANFGYLLKAVVRDGKLDACSLRKRRIKKKYESEMDLTPTSLDTIDRLIEMLQVARREIAEAIEEQKGD